MNLSRYIRRAVTLPPHVVIQKLFRKVRYPWKRACRRLYGSRLPTYLPDLDSSGILFSYLSDPLPFPENYPFDALRLVTDQVVEHHFTLLGSGNIHVRHGFNCEGYEGVRYSMGGVVNPDKTGAWLEGRINSANLKSAKRIWGLIETGYQPIDWYADFRSGYRWRENQWYEDVPFAYSGQKNGVDIKVPWELARLQHLPLLGVAYHAARQGMMDFQSPSVYLAEFQNEVLDFIATNPPQFGVNWACPMEVAIRIANILVAFDLFRSSGGTFELNFSQELMKSVFQHGAHIFNNLEWVEEFRSNHYLANIVGLLFVASYLPRSAEVDVWLAFSIQEFIKEVGLQFLDDGANFEASTSYHRLSTEMIIYGTALILGLNEEKRQALHSYDSSLRQSQPFLYPAPLSMYQIPGTVDEREPLPSWLFERIEKMAEFTMHMSHPQGDIVQFGDNDNGRFLKFQIDHERIELSKRGEAFTEKFLNHSHLVGTVNGLFNRDDFQEFSGFNRIEPFVIRMISHGKTISSFRHHAKGVGAETVRINRKKMAELKSIFEVEKQGHSPKSHIQLWGYPNYGAFAFRTNRIFLAIRCGSVGQNLNGGHAHNDGLSFELSMDGHRCLVDPGTYVYTPFPEKRNLFRSTRVHNTVTFGSYDQHYLSGGREGLFQLLPQSQLEHFHFSEEGFWGKLSHPEFVHQRGIQVSELGIEGYEVCISPKQKRVCFHVDPSFASVTDGESTVLLLHEKSPLKIKIFSDSGCWEIVKSWYSPSYGILRSSQSLYLSSHAEEIRWAIHFT